MAASYREQPENPTYNDWKQYTTKDFAYFRSL